MMNHQTRLRTLENLHLRQIIEEKRVAELNLEKSQDHLLRLVEHENNPLR